MLWRKWLFILVLGTVGAVNAQAPISVLSIQQGLPKSQIYDIIQDSFGFIWLGTRDGLVRFDGHSMELYRKGECALEHNYNYDLFIDDQHRMWLASNADYGGVSVLDLSSGVFENYNSSNTPQLGSNGIMAIDQIGPEEMAIVSKDYKLTILDLADNHHRFWDLNSYQLQGQSTINVTDIFVNPFDTAEIWFCTLNAIQCFNTAENRFTYNVIFKGASPLKFFHDELAGAFLWVSVIGEGGVAKIDLTHEAEDLLFLSQSTLVLRDKIDCTGHSTHSVTDIARKSEQEFYVASERQGLNRFNIQEGEFEMGHHHTLPLEGDVTRCLFSNERGELWLGADKTGLYYLRSSSSPWSITLFPEKSYDTPTFRMHDILPLESGRFLLSVFKYPNLMIWDRPQNSFEEINIPDDSYAYTFGKVGGEIIVGTNNGFYKLNSSADQVVRSPLHDAQSKNINTSIQINEAFWFINWGEGIGRYGDSILHIPGGQGQLLQHRWTHDFVLDSAGRLWIGQEDGLYELDTVTLKVTTHAKAHELNGFPNSNFKALAFDQLGRLWTANFGEGLHCYDVKTRKILSHIGVENGLPSDRIYDLIIDNDGILWAWTSEGLASFSTRKNVLDVDVQFYAESKFLPVDRSGVWFEQLSTTEIFFGVSPGFVIFNPRRLRAQSRREVPAPLVTDIVVVGQSVPFDKGVYPKDAFYFPHNQDFVDFYFSAPRSGFVARQEFSHKLTGVDDTWVAAGTQRKASYTGLKSGDYVFEARVKNETGTWSESSYPIHLTIAQPWYGTMPARILWVLLFATVLGGILFFLRRRQRLQLQLQIQAVESKQLRKLDASKSDFFTQISHEFRTPLTVILGMTEQIATEVSSTSVVTRSLEAINRNSQILLKQINQILDLSKLRSKSISLNMIQGQVIPYLKYLLESLQAHAERKSISLQFETTEEIVMDYDPERLRDIFLNILSNAIKYSSPESSIWIRASKIPTGIDQSFLQISVRDEGVGIESDDIDRIFEAYYRGKNLEAAGSGLGLATSQRWVQAMGGQIEVKSQVGQGSVFTVLLPITRSAREAESLLTSSLHDLTHHGESLQAHNDDKERPQILVVDDNRDVLSYLCFCLSDYQVVLANDGYTALDLAISNVPDLVVSDVMMPNMDGYDLCQAIRSQSATSHIPIILLTAKATQDEKNLGLQHGADAYLTKPFDRTELLIRVEKLLGRQRIFQKQLMELVPGSVRDESSGRAIQHEFLDRIGAYVMANLTEDFTVIELADEVHLSRVQLYRKVKALTGRSTAVFIRLIRLQHAREMLERGHSVSESAYATGFSDPSYFSKVFKAEFGVIPSGV